MTAFAGIYELPEAGRYLYVTAPRKPPHYSALHRWVRSGLPDPEARSIPAKSLFLTFEDLVSLRMIVALRIAGFSLQHVRRVHRWLIEVTGYPRPFALKDLWVSETDIFVEMYGLLSATRRGQYAMEFIKEWLLQLRRPLGDGLDLTFKEEHGKEIASSWTPYPYIVLDPLVQFGLPCLERTRIPTRAVWSMFLGGDRPAVIAKDYNVALAKVQASIEWEEKIAAVVP